MLYRALDAGLSASSPSAGLSDVGGFRLSSFIPPCHAPPLADCPFRSTLGGGRPALIPVRPANVPQGNPNFNPQTCDGRQKGNGQNNGHHKFLLKSFATFLISNRCGGDKK
jgi:hypothetical protein